LRGHAALDFDCASGGIHGAGEFDQHAVARRFDDATAMRSDARVDQRPPGRLQIGKGALFVTAHQTAVAGDIRRQNGRQPPLHALARHDAS
jgi:hypothetical protein